jgi:hypothetical protein
MILYCQHGGTSVRLVYTVMPAPIAGKKSTEKQGGQLKGDNKKPIVALAPHPSGDALCNHPHFIVSQSLLILQVLPFAVTRILSRNRLWPAALA